MVGSYSMHNICPDCAQVWRSRIKATPRNANARFEIPEKLLRIYIGAKQSYTTHFSLKNVSEKARLSMLMHAGVAQNKKAVLKARTEV